MNPKIGNVVAASVVLAGAMSTAALGAEEGWYGGVMGSFVSPDSGRALDDGVGLAAVLGKPLSESASAEFNVFWHENDFERGAGEVQSLGVGGDLNWRGAGSWVKPFLLLGIGAQRDDLPGAEDTSGFGDLGVGLMMLPRPGERALTFRGELRAYYLFKVDSIPGEDNALDVRLNLGVFFGGAARPAPVVAAPPPPAPTPPPSAPAEPPRDGDGDGVMDSADRCPGTARGVAVDSAGCAIIEKVVLKGVNFGSGSATLKPAAHDALRSVAAAMKANEELEVEIGGYTDSVGPDAVNLALSQKRADAVKAFLVKEGVEADRLTTKGYGEASPVDTNDTPEGRSNNRRVEFKVTGS